MRLLRLKAPTLMLTVGALTLPTPLLAQQADAASATVSVDFAKSLGPRVRAERNNNLSRATSFAGQRDATSRAFAPSASASRAIASAISKSASGT